MRLSTGEYTFQNFEYNATSEVYLLKHFQGVNIPGNAEIGTVRAATLSINDGVFEIRDETIGSFMEVYIHQHQNILYASCSCHSRHEALCTHEYATLRAIQQNDQYKAFFDQPARLTLIRAYSTKYGLNQENDFEQYFQVKYDKDQLKISPTNPALVPLESSLGDLLKNHNIGKHKRPAFYTNKTKQQILVISSHRFYDHLRFELLETAITESGKPKGPFNSIDVMPLLWKTKNLQETKFYAAINNFAENYSDTAPENDLTALRSIQQNPLNLPVYIHDRAISEKITPKSLLGIQLSPLNGQLEICVTKKMPFYEIETFFIQDEQRKELHATTIKHRYFLQLHDTYYLIDNVLLLRTIEYFIAKPKKLLIHHSKYEEFLHTTLLPLEELLVINYTFIRKATVQEITLITENQQRVIYLNQEGSYVSITPVIRYGNIEVPLYSKRNITGIDQNGNEYQVQRNKLEENKFISLITRMHSAFIDQLSERTYFYLHYIEFLEGDWFLDVIDYWKREGIIILGFSELQITKRNPNKAAINIEILSGTKWFETKFQIKFGKQEASIKQLYRSVRNNTQYIQLDDGTIGMIPEDWLQKIAGYFQLGIMKSGSILISKIASESLRDLANNQPFPAVICDELNFYTKAIAGLKEITLTVPSKKLKATLRSYQLEGLSWLVKLDKLNLGGCLADDMGLGKTVQIIAFLLYQKENHPSTTNLVTCPTSLISNWKEELEKFAPNLKTLILHGSDRMENYASLNLFDVVITTYGLMVSDIDHLEKFSFNCIILDESQAIKNPNSERNKKAQLLNARTRFVVTGTPIENNTLDLFGQLSFACPGLLGTKQFFKDTYATPIDRFEDNRRQQTLIRKIEPFILRRTKKQVAQELPEKTEITILCEMGQIQRAIYQHHESELRDYVNTTKDEEAPTYNMHVLAGLMRLRQICNAPFLLKNGYDKNISSKIEAMLEQLDSIASNHKVLIFSQFTGMLDIIASTLSEREMSFEILTGATKDRASVIKRFNEDVNSRIFLISLKAGGTGLNLTAADYVFLMDPWWNPAAENQAIDRVHRIGQTKNVVAIRFICPDTVEEKIGHLQNKKRQLATDLIKSENAQLSKVNRKIWIDLLS